MTDTMIALLGYASWTLLLLGAIAAQRSALTLSGARAANSFSSAGDDISPFSARLSRAHANCYEFFPIFAGLLVVAEATGNAELTDPLALWALFARVAQSLVHLASVSSAAVTVRFAFFFMQFAIAVWWALRLWSL